MNETIFRYKKRILLVAIAFFAGAFWIIALRFITFKSTAVHYHANFAVFVDGQRVAFDNPLNYEEVQLCGGDEEFNPKTRVHMHDLVDHILHVHDAGATWGHFFANIGLVNGDTVFRDGKKTYVEGKNTDIRFYLNGEEVETTANRTIKSEDVLLVSIGKSTDEDLQNQYAEIQQDAADYNQKNDPSSCSGGKELTLTERLKKAVGLFND